MKKPVRLFPNGYLSPSRESHPEPRPAGAVRFALSRSGRGNPADPAREGRLSSARMDRVSGLIRDHIEQQNIAGAVVLIARKGKIAYFAS